MAALGALGLALAGMAQLVWGGPLNSGIGSGAALLAVRLDAVSASLVLLVSFVGWIVVRYSRTYLDGEEREGRFHGLMLATLAAVVLLVQAGSLLVVVLCFVAVGLALRQLLLFYPERPEARRAAAKFALVWGAGDIALILASAARLQPGNGQPRGTQCGCGQRPARRGTAWRGAARPRRSTQDRGLPAARLAHRGDGGADARFGAAACRHHQRRRLPADLALPR
jgi:hypothetical protein